MGIGRRLSRRQVAGLLRSCLPLLAVLAASGGARAQEGCTAEARPDPPRRVFRCPGGLVIEAEAATRLRILAPRGQAQPTSAEVEARAVLVRLGDPRPFRILTPHAIAAVRGTVYAVDVASAATSVFVVQGDVRVSEQAGRGAVTLGPGEGVDVTPGRPLEVKRWPQERVRRLLARFGR